MPYSSSVIFAFTCIAASIFSSQNSLAQKGDLKDPPNVVQNENWKKYQLPTSPILSPEDALDSFQIADGFKLELVASEPLVNDPVAITWDEQGRMYVAEMWAYMPNTDGLGEDQVKGRVVVVEDTDNDGLMDRSSVFLDKLIMPRAVSAVKGGVLIAEPPHLWFCADKNNDRQCDEKIRVSDYATTGSIEHMENGLLYGINNWIYNARSSRKFQWDGETLTSTSTAWRGQWGLSQDSVGRLYSSDNSNPIRVDFYPFQNNNRNTGFQSLSGIGIALHPDRDLYSRRPNPGVNRAYYNDVLREDGRLDKATAISGPTVYRGHQYADEFFENIFFTEPAANLVGRIKTHQRGIELTGEHVTYFDETWERLDFITSTDERFRPVNAYTGPDGYLYIVDMYRGILQHKEFLTSYLRKQIIERELDKPVGLGRIYRVVPKTKTSYKALPNLKNTSEKKRVRLLAHSNGWVRDTAQRLLTQSDTLKKGTIKALKKMINTGDAYSPIHALWILNTHQALDIPTVTKALQHTNYWVRIHTLRSAEALFKNKTLNTNEKKHLTKVILSQCHAPEALLRLQCYQSLGALQGIHSDIDTQIVNAFIQLYKPDSENTHFIEATISSLNTLELEFIQAARKHHYQLKSPGRERIIAGIAQALFVKQKSQNFIELLSSIQSNRHWLDTTILNTLTQFAQNPKNARLPLMHKKELEPALNRLTPIEQEAIALAFEWPGKTNTNPLANLNEAEIASIKRGASLYAHYCTGCHQENGEGFAGFAPPLSESEWVNESPGRLALIITHGLNGPIQVRGKTWNGIMPAHGDVEALQKQGLADLISFMRSSWNNASGPVSYEQLKTVLEKFNTRHDAWGSETLNNALK